jgi:hypothetical protein
VIPAIRYLGVEVSLVGACSVLVIGVAALAPPRRRRTWALALAAAAAIALFIPDPGRRVGSCSLPLDRPSVALAVDEKAYR